MRCVLKFLLVHVQLLFLVYFYLHLLSGVPAQHLRRRIEVPQFQEGDDRDGRPVLRPRGGQLHDVQQGLHGRVRHPRRVRRGHQHGPRRHGDAAEVHLRQALPHGDRAGLHGRGGEPAAARGAELRNIRRGGEGHPGQLRGEGQAGG